MCYTAGLLLGLQFRMHCIQRNLVLHALLPVGHHPDAQHPSLDNPLPRYVRRSMLRDVWPLPVEDNRQDVDLADGSFAGTDWINRLHGVVRAVDLITGSTIDNYDNKLHYARPVAIVSVTLLILLSRSFLNSVTRNCILIQAKRPNTAARPRSMFMLVCRWSDEAMT